MFSAKMDRKQIIILNKEELDSRDTEYWKSAAVKKIANNNFFKGMFLW